MARRTVPGTSSKFIMRSKNNFDSGVFVMISTDLNGVSPLSMIFFKRVNWPSILLITLRRRKSGEREMRT